MGNSNERVLLYLPFSSRGEQGDVPAELFQRRFVQDDPVLRYLDLGSKLESADADLVQSSRAGNIGGPEVQRVLLHVFLFFFCWVNIFHSLLKNTRNPDRTL